MNDIDRLLARAQVSLAFYYATGFLASIALLIFLPKPMDDTTKTILISMMGVLGTLATLQNNFFFARQRAPTVPETDTPGVPTNANPPSQPTATPAPSGAGAIN